MKLSWRTALSASFTMVPNVLSFQLKLFSTIYRALQIEPLSWILQIEPRLYNGSYKKCFLLLAIWVSFSFIHLKLLSHLKIFENFAAVSSWKLSSCQGREMGCNKVDKRSRRRWIILFLTCTGCVSFSFHACGSF